MEYRKHYGVYGLIVDPSDKENLKILAVKKLLGPYKGLLDIPGGTPEENETPDETLKRELKEELGAEIRSESRFYTFDVHAVNTEKENYEFHHFGKLKILLLKDLDLPQIRSKDVDGYEWIELNKKGAGQKELNEKLSITLKNLLDQLKTEIKMFVNEHVS